MVSDDGLHHGGDIGFVSEVCNSVCLSKRRRHDGRKRKKDGEIDEKKHELNRGETSQS